MKNELNLENEKDKKEVLNLLQDKMSQDPEFFLDVSKIIVSVYELFKQVASDPGTDQDTKIETKALMSYFNDIETIGTDPEKAIDLMDKILAFTYNPKVETDIKLDGSTKPDSIFQPITKLNEILFDGGKTDLANEKLIRITPEGQTDPKAVTAQVTYQIFYDDKLLPEYLNPYDREVFNAVCTLALQGNKAMTERQIYEAMSGKPAWEEQALKKLKKSLQKMMVSLLNMDWTQHAILKGVLENGDKFKTQEPVLPARIVNISIRGQEAEGIQLFTKPALLTYACAVGQITSTPKEVLQTPTSNTDDNIVMKNYLIRYIEHCKKNKNWNRTLLFEKIYNDCNFDQSNKTTLKRRRDTIFKMLDYWNELKYIKQYSIKKKGNKYHAIEFDIVADQKSKTSKNK